MAHGAPTFVDTVARLRARDLDFVARSVVDGFVGGAHRSPHFGSSMDFAEHRPYGPGDDIRRIDWKLFARTDRFHVKQFEADSNANFLILLDVSRSMRFGSPLTKLEYAAGLAACLAYVAAGQKDRVGLLTFDRRVRTFIPPKAGRLDAILAALSRLPEAEGHGALAPAIDRAAEASRRRGVLVLLSDLYEEPEEAARLVRRLRYRGSDVMAFHVLDPAERAFPFEGPETFEDLETGDRVPADGDRIRDEYRAMVEEHIRALRRTFGAERIDYALADTGTPLDRTLRRALLARKA